MCNIRNEIVPDGIAGRMYGRVRLDVGGHVEGADGESDDGGVALGDEFVLGEALDMEEEVGWQGVQEAVAFARVEVFLGFDAVVLGKDGGQWDLGRVSDLSGVYGDLGTCGMMFLSSSSWNKGAAGKSSVSIRYRLVSTRTSAASSNRSRSPASALAVICWLSTLSFP